jgi:hypothetical protein
LSPAGSAGGSRAGSPHRNDGTVAEWQTRGSQNPVSVTGVRVRISPVLLRGRSSEEERWLVRSEAGISKLLVPARVPGLAKTGDRRSESGASWGIGLVAWTPAFQAGGGGS